MRKLLALAAILALSAIACDRTCESGAICGDYNTVGPTVPSPTPRPDPSATPDPCRIESIRVSWHSGAQLPFLALGATEQLDATPMNSSGEVPKGCNVVREPAWATLTPLTCSVIGSGYNPFLRGLRVGSCSITASMVWDNRTITSTPFSPEVR